MSAQNLGEGITCKHGTFAGSASGDHEIRCTGVQKNCCQNTVLYVGQGIGILCAAHTVVEYFMTHGLYYFFKSSTDHFILGSLTVFIDQSYLHEILLFQTPQQSAAEILLRLTWCG